MIELLWAGLLLIAISWAIQIFSLTKEKKHTNRICWIASSRNILTNII